MHPTEDTLFALLLKICIRQIMNEFCTILIFHNCFLFFFFKAIKLVRYFKSPALQDHLYHALNYEIEDPPQVIDSKYSSFARSIIGSPTFSLAQYQALEIHIF